MYAVAEKVSFVDREIGEVIMANMRGDIGS